jgi:hypothetical protein
MALPRPAVWLFMCPFCFWFILPQSKLPPGANRILFVKNLNYQITGEDLYDLFGRYGSIRQIRIGDEAKTKGTAFVVFDDVMDVCPVNAIIFVHITDQLNRLRMHSIIWTVSTCRNDILWFYITCLQNRMQRRRRQIWQEERRNLLSWRRNTILAIHRHIVGPGQFHLENQVNTVVILF